MLIISVKTDQFQFKKNNSKFDTKNDEIFTLLWSSRSDDFIVLFLNIFWLDYL